MAGRMKQWDKHNRKTRAAKPGPAGGPSPKRLATDIVGVGWWLNGKGNYGRRLRGLQIGVFLKNGAWAFYRTPIKKNRPDISRAIFSALTYPTHEEAKAAAEDFSSPCTARPVNQQETTG